MLTTEIPEVNSRKSAETENPKTRFALNIIMLDAPKVVGKMVHGMAMKRCTRLIVVLFIMLKTPLRIKGIL